jgi:hypothetical protein
MGIERAATINTNMPVTRIIVARPNLNPKALMSAVLAIAALFPLLVVGMAGRVLNIE